MNKSFKLGRLNQCEKCPWKVSTNPHDIPNGYSCDMHQNLAGTIAEPGAPPDFSKPLRIMACHDSPNDKPQHCIGWLHNQMGEGNNTMLRFKMRDCTNIDGIRLDGPQHAHFNDTLPA